MMIRWLLRAVKSMLEPVNPIVFEPIPAPQTSRIFRRLQNLVALAAIVSSLILLSLPVGAAGAGEFPAVPVKARKTVAAGFGYQNAESSTITVKTYDAESGEVLSDESYELDIKEDGPVSSTQPRERIFAGGVGLGADGLSEFTLRVYDATDGRFLWEGRLNLGVSSAGVEAVPVVARIQPRAAVERVSLRSHRDGQPYFLLRVLDPETGQLVWSDQFSTEAATVRAERINRSVVGAIPMEPRDVDFRIQMFDEAGQRLLWEDKVTQAVEGSGASSELGDEDAEVIPQWLIGPTDSLIREMI